MPDTYLSQAVDATADAGAAYDANAKYLLADKQILAYILKYAVSEFGDMEIPAIAGCIGDNIEIGSKPVDPGLSGTGRVSGTAAEDNVPGEGMIYYDIRFSAYLAEKEIKFLMNMEAQKSSDYAVLGYHLENRILFYLARMVSAQKQTEFFHSDFDSLKRVRSIWVCMDGKEDEDAIEEIGLCRKAVFGKEGGQYGMDLMKAVIIHIRSKNSRKASANVLIRMLETLFAQLEAEEKKRQLKKDYGMAMSVEMERRIQVMCNLSEAIWENAIQSGLEKGMQEGLEKGLEKGMQEGLEKGMQEGLEKGIRQERISAIARMIHASASREQILSYGYTQAEYAEAEQLLPANG